MKNWMVVVLCVLLMATGCDALGNRNDTKDDATSAQNLMPNFDTYTSVQTESVQDALNKAIAAGTLATGNPLGAVAVARIDSMITCYRDKGAVDARMFISKQLESGFPVVGVLGVINETRVVGNFVECAVNPAGPRAQSAGPQPCTGSGRVTIGGENILYVYGASSQTLCDRFTQHFQTLAGQ